jgi:uncharacterized protein (DUF58 family)
LRTVALLGLVALLAAVIPAPLALAVAVVVVIAFGVDAWSVRQPPPVRRVTSAEVVRGVPVGFRVEVDAGGASRVEVRQPQTAELRVSPAEGLDGIDGEVVALARGVHRLAPVVVRRTGPLGLGRWVHQVGGDLDVASHADLPGARRMAAAVRQGTFRDPGLRRGPIGLGTDFESIREYTPDDDLRHVNWLASERTGHPMVNTYREDTERDLWCLVDVGRLLASPVGDRTRLDAALDALAAVAAVADAVGDRVGAVVFDREVRRVVTPRRANAAALVRSLDDLQPALVDSDYEGAFARVGSTKRSLVIVFTDLLDAAAAQPLVEAVPVLARRHAVLVASAGDPDLAAAVTRTPVNRRDLAEAGVASDLLAERDLARSRIAASGAVVVDAPPDGLSSRCVAAYLRLKSTARI